MGGLLRDVAWALRSLRRSPGFTAVAVLTLALGMGANTAIFSVVQAVLLRPLPYRQPEQLVVVWADLHRRNLANFPLSPPDYLDVRDGTPSLAGTAAVLTFPSPLVGEGEPEQLTVAGVTTNFFDVLGVDPVLGRTFVPEDGTPGAPDAEPGQPGFLNQTAVISHALWRQRFGADPGVIGRVVELGGPTEIVGVMPEGLQVLMPAAASVDPNVDVWTVPRFDLAAAPRGNVFLRVVARLRPGASLEQVNADLDRIAAQSQEKLPGWAAAGLDFRAVSLHGDLTAGVRPVILVLMGAVAFVLLIACANVSNLLLVRATARQRELAVRAALGGSRTRLVRQLLAESLVIAGAGALLGALLAWVGIDVLLRFRPEGLPRLDRVALDPAVLGFTALAGLAAAVLFGVLPSVQASRPNLADSLKDRGGASVPASQRRLRSGVVIAEVALSLVLLVGAGIMARTFGALQRVELGFRPEGVVTFTPNLPFPEYRTNDDRERFFAQLQERLAAQPGVTAVSAGQPLPMEGDVANGRWSRVEDMADPTTYKQATYYAAAPGLFETLGTRLLEGRFVTRAEEADSAAVVVVDRALAERAFPGESALGKSLHVRVSAPEGQLVQIVGVVENQRHLGLTGPVRESIYFTPRFAAGGDLVWAVRSDLDLAAVTALIKREVAAIEPQIPIEVVPMTRRVDAALAPTRFALVLMAVFGVVALALAAIGLYGVLAFAVRQRTAEIGVRMAFGAERATILKLVVGQGMVLAGAGVALGVVASLGLRGLLTRFIPGVEPGDPTAFVAAPLFFLAVAAIACLVPALRATRVDPLAALRSE